MYNPKKHIRISLDIGYLLTKYICVATNNGKDETITDAKIINTPKGVFPDGENDFDTDILESFLDEIIYKIKTSNKKFKNFDYVVSIGLPYIDNIATHFPSPYYENKDFNKELTNVIYNSNQYDTQNFIFNYSFNNAIDTNMAVCDTLILGYDKEIIYFYLTYFDKKNIFVDSISLNNLSVISLLEKRDNNSYDVDYSLFIDLGANSTEVILLKNGFPLNYFVVNKGGNDLTNQLRDKLQLSLAESEKLKVMTNENHCIYVEDGFELPNDEKAKEVIEILDPVFTKWKGQIYQELNTELKLQKIPYINKIYFSGGSSYIKNFPEAIASMFNASIEEMSLGSTYNINKIQRESDIIYYNLKSFLPALAHLKVKPINLLTQDYIKSKKTNFPNFKGGTFLLVTALLTLIASNVFGIIKNESNNININKVNTRLEKANQSYNIERNAIKNLDLLDVKLNFFTEKLENNLNWSDLMSKIYKSVPSETNIIKIHEVDKNVIEIIGVAKSYAGYGQIGINLEINRALINIQPVSVENQNGAVKFILKGEIPINIEEYDANTKDGE